MTDTQSSGASTPTGTVSFTASPTTGQFANPGSCTLNATATTGIASCQITFTPSAAASYTLTASYTGDSTHLAGSGQSTPITATTPPPVTVKKPPPTVKGRASVKRITTSGATISVRVSCSGTTSCKIKLTGTVLETIRGAKVIAVAASTKTKIKSKKKKTTKKTITIASKTTTIPAGATKTIKLTLNAAGKKLLARHHPLKAKLTITQSGKTLAHKTITLKPKPKPKKKNG